VKYIRRRPPSKLDEFFWTIHFAFALILLAGLLGYGCWLLLDAIVGLTRP
jgi:hypothetical protein